MQEFCLTLGSGTKVARGSCGVHFRVKILNLFVYDSIVSFWVRIQCIEIRFCHFGLHFWAQFRFRPEKKPFTIYLQITLFDLDLEYTIQMHVYSYTLYLYVYTYTV